MQTPIPRSQASRDLASGKAPSRSFEQHADDPAAVESPLGFDDVSSNHESDSSDPQPTPASKKRKRKPREKAPALTQEQEEEIEEALRDAFVHSSTQRRDRAAEWMHLKHLQDDPDCEMTCEEFIAMMTAIITVRRGSWQIR